MHTARLVSIPATVGLTVTLVLAGAAAPAAAGDGGSGLEPLSASDFRLHQSFAACGKKWAKKASRLAPAERAWLLTRSHRIYRMVAGGQLILTLEVLSTPSFRGCDVARDWKLRETTVLARFVDAGGDSRTTMTSFARDEFFFDREPRVFPGLGKVLLRGRDFEGQAVSRWLALDLAPLPAAPATSPVLVASAGAPER